MPTSATATTTGPATVPTEDPGRTCARLVEVTTVGQDVLLVLRTRGGDVLVREPGAQLLVRALRTAPSIGGDGATLLRGRDTSISLLLDALEAADAVASALVVRPGDDQRWSLRIGT